MDPIIESTIKTALETVVNELLKEKSPQAEVSLFRISPVSSALAHYLRGLHSEVRDISFLDLHQSKPLRDAFVELDLFLGPKRTALQEPERQYRTTDLLNLPGNYLILGDPGAGKTTTLKRLAQNLLPPNGTKKSDDDLSRYGKGRAVLPVLVRLRDIREDEGLSSKILELFGISLDLTIANTFTDQAIRMAGSRILTSVLNQFNVLVMLDGFDELPPQSRSPIKEEINELLLHSDGYRLLLTMRSAELGETYPNAQVLEIAPLSHAQIRKFAIKWIGKEKADRFVGEIWKYPYGGSEVRPITLAHLCAIYERRGEIPKEPIHIYRKIVRLLLEEWDEQRGIKRYPKYPDFTVDRKEAFLEALAFHLSFEYGGSTFTLGQLTAVYLRLCARFSLPRGDGKRVLRELESHTGLIAETRFETYEFIHKSIQEYLTASYMIKLPSIPHGVFLVRRPDETALAIASSSEPEAYFLLVIANCMELSPAQFDKFIRQMLARLRVEKTTMFRAPEVGAAMLLVYRRMYSAAGGSEPSAAILQEVSTSLAKVRPLWEALLEFLEFAPERQHSTGTYVVEVANIEKQRIPANLKAYFVRAPTFLIDAETRAEIREFHRLRHSRLS